MKQNNFAILFISLILCVSIYLNFTNRSELKASQSLNDSLLVKFEKEQQAKLNAIKLDSINVIENITTFEKKIVQINWKRKNDKSNYENEIAKYQNLTSDSSYYPIIDSIKAMLLANHNR